MVAAPVARRLPAACRAVCMGIRWGGVLKEREQPLWGRLLTLSILGERFYVVFRT